MAILEDYIAKLDKIQASLSAGNFTSEGLAKVQELEYRICVLETLKYFCKAAPVATDLKKLRSHYSLLGAYFQFLKDERKYGIRTDAAGQKMREEGAQAFAKVLQDTSRQFASFKPTSQELYKRSISQLICAVLPVWIKYRETYIKI